MKFYNPFKPHIVEFADGTFAVRKRGWLGLLWIYKDCMGWSYSTTSNIQWWTNNYLRHCKVKTYDEAVKVMSIRKKTNPDNVVRVIHG